MPHHHHHLIALILHVLAGGALGMTAAALAHHFGVRSADRLPGESRRPACLYCLRLLRWQDISPLVGWLLRPDALSLPCPCGLRKGQWMQPVAEIIGFALGAYGIYLTDWVPAAIPLCLGLGLLPAIALIDIDFGLIPDELNILLALAGFGWAEMHGGDIFMALIVAAALLALGLFCALVYSRLRGREMLGLGDVKFFAAAGLWLQAQTAPWFLALAGAIGIVIGLIWRHKEGGREFPFAPALCASLAVCVLYQLMRMG